MRRFSPFLLLSTLALAQVGLVDGPRPSTEVRGTLQGNAREGYSVVVEFLVESGANPVQGSTNQSLSWDGKLYLCVSGCDHFTLSGYAPNTPYNQVFDLYDSQNRLRGRASVSTVYDSQNRPSYHQVQYAVWPLQGARTWMPSPDNPVPLEAGGWLTVRPPGGSARERYRYPGMESYQPPSVQGSILSGISPADRDVVKKSVLSSLADLRSFYARQPRGSTLWFFVPEVSVWTQTLAREFRARNGGQERFVVPEGAARSYCSLYRNDSRFHVMPRESLAKEQSFAVIYPPSGDTQKGAVMAGRYLVDRPDWQETDYLYFTTPLSPTQEGLPEARALVWGYISQANLKARVEFKEWGLDPFANWYASLGMRSKDWDGRFSAVVGRGDESFYLEGWTPGATWSGTRGFVVRDAQGQYRGTASVTVQGGTITLYNLGTYYGLISPEDLQFSYENQTYTLKSCSGWTRWTCSVVDGSGRSVGTALLDSYYIAPPDYEQVLVLRQVVLTTEPRYTGYASLRGWTQTWYYASDNDRPVEPGGYVTAEGKRYRIPGLEGYLQPTGKDLEVAEGDPYVSYITRSLSPQGNPFAGTGREEAKLWFKPLRDWCAERGL
ncbi:hypothetical protein [Thermus thermophilus]|uniref:Lipoprotein n=1 Tax=Thermus thermophilus TaxID=274 RepID=A0A7R7THL9_THETH|nr:hypothetical protein [Thermus thermophilus]BCP67647.1 hypothetical protein TthHB5018_c25810 [Thermus thermophilus]